MTWYTIDSIVKQILLEQRKPIHWYLEYLTHATSALRELHFDHLRNVKTVKLTINSYKAVAIPCDYVDWVRVGVVANDKVKALVQSSNINRLNNFDTSGNKVKWPIDESTVSIDDFYMWRTDIYEYTGGFYNHRPDLSSTFFKVLPERGEIQLESNNGDTEIILEYISDGLDADAATKVDPYATDAIKTYVMWQVELNNRQYSKGDADYRKRLHDAAVRKLRARKNPLSKEDILNAVRKGYSATYKN